MIIYKYVYIFLNLHNDVEKRNPFLKTIHEFNIKTMEMRYI